MKKLLAVVVSAVAVVGLVGSAMAADKLLVKDAATNNILRVETDPAMVNVTSGGASKSLLHFSLAGADSGGYVSSLGENNFFVSSGAAYDSGSWVQKSTDGKAVIAGSGPLGYRVFTASGTAVGSPIALTTRMMIDYSGNVGFGITPTYPLHMASGARVTVGGVWTNASSRSYKENIQELSAEKAIETVKKLSPVVYNYKSEPEHTYVGFIAEDVPGLVAMQDRKSLSPMDVVAVLTKVVQEQTKTIEALSAKIDKLENSSK